MTVGNGSTVHLNNVLVAPILVHNPLFVRHFTRDNSCSIEFDTLGFSIRTYRQDA
jgi:hypothetical protein